MPEALLNLGDPGQQGAGWADWPGDWGAPPERAPQGPGYGSNHDHFYEPWGSECARDNNGCPREFAGPSALERARSSKLRGNDQCAAWFGVAVVAAACSPPRLRASLVNRWRSRPVLTFKLAPRFARKDWSTAAAAAGIAQALAPPLRPGQTLTLRGRAGSGSHLLVRTTAGRFLLEARFHDLGLTGGGNAVLVAGRDDGRPTVALLRPDGRKLKPQAMRRVKIALRRRPRVLRAHRRGRLLRVAYSTPGAYTRLQLTATRHGRALSERTFRTRQRRQETALRLPRRARYLRLTAFARNGATSRLFIAPLPRRR